MALAINLKHQTQVSVRPQSACGPHSTVLPRKSSLYKQSAIVAAHLRTNKFHRLLVCNFTPEAHHWQSSTLLEGSIHHWIIMPSKEELRELLSDLDKNGDGKIGVKELKELMESCGDKIDRATVEQFIEDYDLDKDGKLDLNELVNSLADS
ncbi:unnamed protein product [Dicrocoelium dendriticum]|nr:unnamed protein product [Dicrocoelium dendriticum]